MCVCTGGQLSVVAGTATILSCQPPRHASPHASSKTSPTHLEPVADRPHLGQLAGLPVGQVVGLVVLLCVCVGVGDFFFFWLEKQRASVRTGTRPPPPRTHPSLTATHRTFRAIILDVQSLVSHSGSASVISTISPSSFFVFQAEQFHFQPSNLDQKSARWSASAASICAWW